VELGLQARGLEVSLPRITVRRRRRDRFQLLEVPLFSGYLFVHSILSPPAYYHIIKQPGVVCILGSKGRYTPVSAETVASIQTVQESGRSFSPWSKLVPGRRVRVVAGPLGGAVGTIWRGKPARRRLVVGLELLGRSVAVDLEEECVEPFF
jgi:transcriptional antiterminator NusG